MMGIAGSAVRGITGCKAGTWRLYLSRSRSSDPTRSRTSLPLLPRETPAKLFIRLDDMTAVLEM